MIKDRLLYLVILVFLGFFLIASIAIGLYAYRSANQSSDVSVLLNAEQELMYPETTFLLSQKVNGSTYLCGGTALDSTHIVTAAHCIADSVKVKVGASNEIYLGAPLKEVDTLNVEENWQDIGSKIIENASSLDAFTTYSDNDIAILKIKDSSPEFTSIAKVGNFATGCGYELTAYGTTLDEIDSDLKFPRLKESISVCLSYYNGKTIRVLPESGTGVCLGDSGSPIYRKGTNEVVAIISMVLSDDANQLCKIDNLALATVVGSHQGFISQYIDLNNEDNVLAEDVPVETTDNVTAPAQAETSNESTDELVQSREGLEEELNQYLEVYKAQLEEYKTPDINETDATPTSTTAQDSTESPESTATSAQKQDSQQNANDQTEVKDVIDNLNEDVLDENTQDTQTYSSTTDNSKRVNQSKYIAIDIPNDFLIWGSIIFSIIYILLISIILLLLFKKGKSKNTNADIQPSLLKKNFNNI
ncbi:trypsin-like serine protease [Candidatus Dojkabacteria bacterium]|uniref:Trypsin-like serine protease n=1 Tax=Candidatus Dojkabacteria bacterium TaxID=2099670 RepID=A0A955IF33_9BACT|nr:trypsin-like serine protease [Candidatus Dojkabacteria bacterium]